MSKRSYARTIYLIHPNDRDVPTDLEAIKREYRRDIPTMPVDDLMLAAQHHQHKILLMDYHQHDRVLNQVKELLLLDKNFEYIIYNVPHRLVTTQLLKLGQLKGLFYKEESLEHMIKGFERICAGENWLPRHVTSQLLHYYRNMTHTQTSPNAASLTIREVDILKCLKQGSSNMQIADMLCISEFTVKSHLYHIFKKLSVKNRVQAIAWAHQNVVY
ncbi:response regulator transcription factor [Vibrio maerlii]|uniref:response regulator transcription factor n=1 Tax=Vibrio maerlii TaxID=2231648 RepID=UPI000E3DCAE4|nr:response regulator transcription factor [Vibrio maerlii]